MLGYCVVFSPTLNHQPSLRCDDQYDQEFYIYIKFVVGRWPELQRIRNWIYMSLTTPIALRLMLTAIDCKCFPLYIIFLGGGGPGASVQAACLESWRSWVQTPLRPSSFKETKCFFPAPHLAQVSLYVHKGGLKLHSLYFIFINVIHFT